MPQILDAELRRLFKTESSERLQRLDSGLLQLEKGYQDAHLIEDLFREAHSLKGAARMLGLLNIQDLAHHLEDNLAVLRKGELVPDAAFVQQQLKTLDALRQSISAAVDEAGPTTADAPQEQKAVSGPDESTPETSLKTTPAPALSPVQGADAVSAKSITMDDRDFRIETLRVEASRLDFLLSQTGELVVCRNHTQRLQNELEQVLKQARQIPDELLPVFDHLNLLSARFSEDSTRLNVLTQEIESGIRNLRLLPASVLLELFPRMVHDLAREQGKKVDLQLIGGDIVVDKRIIEERKAPLMHLLRNAVDHGIETPQQRLEAGKPEISVLRVSVEQEAGRVHIEVRDDGRGLDLDAVRAVAVNRGFYTQAEAAALDSRQLHSLIVQQGFSTSTKVTDVSGRGVGLNVVGTTVERLHGTLTLDSSPGKGMSVHLGLPVSLISTRILLVRDFDHSFAFPFEHVERILRPLEADIRWIEGRPCIEDSGGIVFLGRLGVMVNCPGSVLSHEVQPYCVLLRHDQFRIGILVAELQGEQDVVIKPLPFPLRKSDDLLGVTIIDSGLVCPVLNVRNLSAHILDIPHSDTKVASAKEGAKVKRILLAEDSITTRLQEKRILESAGYQVVVAVDGLDAWMQLARSQFDAVVSDIMMPNLTGLELTQRMRANKAFADIPVVLLTSLASDDDRRKGLEVGADAYLTKPEFDQSILLECLERLI